MDDTVDIKQKCLNCKEIKSRNEFNYKIGKARDNSGARKVYFSFCIKCHLNESAKCAVCGQIKKFIDFHAVMYGPPRYSDYRLYIRKTCIICQKEYRKLDSKKYKDRLAKYRKTTIAENKKWFNDIKSQTPCTDCGKCYPFYVMDYDHVGKKRYNISRMIQTHTNRCRIAHELKHCDLVCSNCHRIRTYARKENKGRASTLRTNIEFIHLPNCKCQEYSGLGLRFPKNAGGVVKSDTNPTATEMTDDEWFGAPDEKS